MIEIDVRGFSCPIPVVRTRQAIEDNPGQVLSVLVETVVSKENVTRFAASKGYSVEAQANGDEFSLQLTPPER